MSEGLSRRDPITEGFELQRQDETDPVRGPIVRLSRKVFKEAMLNGNTALREEFATFCDSTFPQSFENPSEARNYRLYHYIIGGSPTGNHSDFDMEGENSIAKEMERLAEKYNIDTDGV